MDKQVVITISDEEFNYCESYRINAKGVIITPGRFHGDYSYVPYVYCLIQFGHSDTKYDEELKDTIEVVEVNDAMREIWPELKHTQAICVWENHEHLIYSYKIHLNGEAERYHSASDLQKRKKECLN